MWKFAGFSPEIRLGGFDSDKGYKYDPNIESSKLVSNFHDDKDP